MSTFVINDIHNDMYLSEKLLKYFDVERQELVKKIPITNISFQQVRYLLLCN